MRDGLTGSLFFWYDRGSRSKKTARELLGGYCGTFQSDGYEAYEQFCGISGVQGAACWAHARRKFVDALKENQKLATQAIVMIGKLYEVERKADEAGMSVDQRRELRQKEAYPVIQLMENWCVDTYTEVLESSLLGKAIAYTYSLMGRLAIYVNDGRINIDNNLIENAIRPLALGRKNWLFCGNDASAYRAAIAYSLIASCRAADVDPRQWLEHGGLNTFLPRYPPAERTVNPWKTSFRVNMPDGPILNHGIFPTLTDQNANKHPQNSTKKPEHPQRSGFFVLFLQIVQYVLYRMLTIVSPDSNSHRKFSDEYTRLFIHVDNQLETNKNKRRTIGHYISSAKAYIREQMNIYNLEGIDANNLLKQK